MGEEKIVHVDKTDDELKQIAVDLYDGKIFTDRHCNSKTDISMTFMVIALGAFKDMTEDQLKDIGLIYEYLSEAGPRSCNGKPMFMSARYLNKSETQRMFIYYEDYKRLKELFLKKKENSSKNCDRNMSAEICSVSPDCNTCEHYTE